ncbi:MAG TPA: hypothetical protein VGT03_10075 [Candidatus Acidoferrales bacterium]|nr:hypothetical protein [Candidatus Acidoferrales bacterium]
MNSPGASISLKETSRKSTGRQTVVFYRIMTSGMPKDGLYQLVLTSFDLQPKPIQWGISLDESGQAVCSGQAGGCGQAGEGNDPIDLGLVAAKGEPKRFTLVSQDGKVKAFAYVVPFPIKASDGACSIEAILLLQHAEAVLIQGAGFAANSTVHMKSSSESEVIEGELKADVSGNVFTVLLPYVKGKTDGTGKVSFTSPACSPSLTYQWGLHSFQEQ